MPQVNRNGEPVRKPTREEYDERVDMCVRLLGQGLRKGEIVRAVKAHYKVQARSVETYLARARSIICAETGKTKEEHRADAYVILKELQRSKNELVRLKSTAELVKLVGAAVPQEHRVKGDFDLTSGGEPLPPLIQFVMAGEAEPLDEEIEASNGVHSGS